MHGFLCVFVWTVAIVLLRLEMFLVMYPSTRPVNIDRSVGSIKELGFLAVA